MAAARLLTAKQVEELTEGGITAKRAQQAARLGIFPKGVVVRIGRQVRWAETPLLKYLEDGGSTLPFGWRWKLPKRPAQAAEDHPQAAGA